MEQPESLSERVVELEIRWMQLQRDFEALNAVVLAQQQELVAWRGAFARFEARLDTLGEPESPRDPLAEKPPHY